MRFQGVFLGSLEMLKSCRIIGGCFGALNLHTAVMSKIRKSNAGAQHKTPEIIFSKCLDGPWNPEVLVHRVLVKDSKPVTSGGIDRFVI